MGGGGDGCMCMCMRGGGGEEAEGEKGREGNIVFRHYRSVFACRLFHLRGYVQIYRPM